MLNISIWGIETFSGVLSGDVTGLEFRAPCDSVDPPNWDVWSAADTALFALHFGIAQYQNVIWKVGTALTMLFSKWSLKMKQFVGN